MIDAERSSTFEKRCPYTDSVIVGEPWPRRRLIVHAIFPALVAMILIRRRADGSADDAAHHGPDRASDDRARDCTADHARGRVTRVGDGGNGKKRKKDGRSHETIAHELFLLIEISWRGATFR